MLRKSLNKYIKAQMTELTTVLDASPDLILSTITKPFAVISYMQGTQVLWDLGDAHRQDNVRVQVSLFCNSFDEQLNLKNKLTRVIESATADISTTSTPQLEPGIVLYGLFDKLTTANNLLFSSAQANWYTTFTPVVYKNGSVVSATLYTVNYTNGTITFGTAQAAGSDIRADYKAGVIDFSITMVVDIPITDVANFTHKYNSFFTLDTYFYVRTKGQKLY